MAIASRCPLRLVDVRPTVQVLALGLVIVFTFASVAWPTLAAPPPPGFIGPCAPTFSQPPGSPFGTGLNPNAVAVGTFNADGNLDLAVTSQSPGKITILLGNGDGTFTPAPGSPFNFGSGPDAVAVGHFNADSNLDLAVANGVSNNVGILLGNGDGTFTQASGSPIAVGSTPAAVAVGTFNVDGNLDLAVAIKNLNAVRILLGNGDGTFTEAPGSPSPVGSAPQGVTVGSFNGDANADLAVANFSSDNVTILLGNGDGTFAQAPGSPISVGTLPDSVAAGNFNGDANADLAVANFSSNNVSILSGNGDGTFVPAAGSPFAAGTNLRAIAAASFNGDGFDDLAISNLSTSHLTVLLDSCTLADLGVTVSGSPTPVSVGTDQTYTITAQNLGPSSSSSVTLSDPLPANTTFVSVAIPPGWSCTPPAVGTNGTLTCTIGIFAAGSATFTLVVHVDPSATVGSTLHNVVSIDSATTADEPGTNNSGSADTIVAAAPTATPTVTPTPTSTATPTSTGTPISTLTPTLTPTPTSTAIRTLASDAAALWIYDLSVTEGNGGPTSMTFTVDLNRVTTAPVTVQYATQDGTATTADTDYQPASGTLTFAPGELTKTVTVTVNGDTKVEPDESFTLTLSTPSNASIAKGQAVGVIVNDDIGVASACSPRPPVTVTSKATGDGRLQVTLAVGTQGPNGANRLSELRFGAGTNALIDVEGQTGKNGAFTVSLTGTPTSVTFFVRRATPGQATTVPLTIVDTCGDWPIFVGGGPTAF